MLREATSTFSALIYIYIYIYIYSSWLASIPLFPCRSLCRYIWPSTNTKNYVQINFIYFLWVILKTLNNIYIWPCKPPYFFPITWRLNRVFYSHSSGYFSSLIFLRECPHWAVLAPSFYNSFSFSPPLIHGATFGWLPKTQIDKNHTETKQTVK